MPGLDLRSILISILVLCVSLSLHEYSHARVAFALGDDTAKKRGRMTLNPLVHIDPMGALAFIFAKVGWAKPVPVNYSKLTRTKNRKLGVLLVSVAGPASNFLLSFIAAFFLNAWRVLLEYLTLREAVVPATGQNLLMLAYYIFIAFFQSNIFLGIFNLLPFPPLDGSKILAYFLPDKLYRNLAKYEQFLGMGILLLFIFGRSYLSRVMTFLARPFIHLLNAPWEFLADAIIVALRGA